MSSLIRVARLPPDGGIPYPEDMAEPLKALLQTFGISRQSANNLSDEGYNALADLAFLDEEGAGFVNQGILNNFLALGHGQAQRQRLLIMVEKFVFICRPESGFNVHGDPALVYDVVLPTLDVVALAAQTWANRMDAVGAPPAAAAVPVVAAAPDRVAPPLIAPVVAPAVAPDVVAPAPGVAAVDGGNQQAAPAPVIAPAAAHVPQLAPVQPPVVQVPQAPVAVPDPPNGQGSGLQVSRKRDISSGSSSDSDADTDKHNQLPSNVRFIKVS